MAHENMVLRSIETPDGDRCVDLFRRPDGTFGFEEFRREIEDGHGWYPIGFHDKRIYESEDKALADARVSVSWLADDVQIPTVSKSTISTPQPSVAK